MKKLSNLSKIFIVVTLVLLLAGMSLIGFLGFNSSAEYAKKSYEIVVSVDQDVKSSGANAKTASIKYFEENNVKISKYATQTAEDNTKFIFKVEQFPDGAETALKDAVVAGVNDAERIIDVKIYEVKPTLTQNAVPLIIAFSIALVVFLVYELIVDKLAIALSAIFTAIISGLVFASIISLARIPAYPYFALTLTLAVALGTTVSIVLLNRFKELSKLVGNEKLTSQEIAEMGVKQSIVRLCVVAGTVLVSAIAFACFGGYSLYLGLQLLVAGVSAIYASVLGTPLIYSLLKK